MVISAVDTTVDRRDKNNKQSIKLTAVRMCEVGTTPEGEKPLE